MVRTCRSRQHSSSDLHPNNSPPPPLPPQTSILPNIFSPPPFPFVSLQLRAPLLFSCPGDSTGIDWGQLFQHCAVVAALQSASRGRYIGFSRFHCACCTFNDIPNCFCKCVSHGKSVFNTVPMLLLLPLRLRL